VRHKEVFKAEMGKTHAGTKVQKYNKKRVEAHNRGILWRMHFPQTVGFWSFERPPQLWGRSWSDIQAASDSREGNSNPGSREMVQRQLS
jgi:hypothetical protein